MIKTVVVAVPESLESLYVVPTRRPPADLPRRLAAVADRLESPLDDLLRQMIDTGLLHCEVRRRTELPPLPEDILTAFGACPEQLRQFGSAAHAIVVRAGFRPGWPPAHEWSARAVAAQLAAELDAPVLDAFTPRLARPAALWASLPTRERTIAIAEWLLIPQSNGPSGCWLTTKGLGRFGLPELQALAVPPQLGRPCTRALSGLAGRLLKLGAQALAPSGPNEDEVPAFIELPRTVRFGAADVARAYGAWAGRAAGGAAGGAAGQGSEDSGDSEDDADRVSVGLRLDPPTDLIGDTFLTMTPPDSFPASRGEFYAAIFGKLFGAPETQVRHVRGSAAMAAAMLTARRGLPGIRDRLLRGDLPPGAQVMVKHPVRPSRAGRDEPAAGPEYVWAFVTDWADPGHLIGSCADDAGQDPAIRAGRPVRVETDAVVDWAVWVDGEGVVEGGRTDELLTEE